MTVTRQEKLAAVRDAATYRPLLAAGVVALSLVSALLEGIGVGFILPIVEQTRAAGSEGSWILSAFETLYDALGVPFALEYLVLGVALVMGLRFATSFLVAWLRATLETGYRRVVQQRLFEALAFAPIASVDDAGSDDLLNSLVTETNRVSTVVYHVVSIVETALRGLIYLVLAAVLSIELTLLAVLALGASTLLTRVVLEPAYGTGDRVAEANSRMQSTAQAGVQGMRDVRLYTGRSEVIDRMADDLDRFVAARVRLVRDKAALNNLNQFTNALVVFGLIYAGIRFTALSLGEIGVFLFAVYRLSPTLTQLNHATYALDGVLPHLVRIQERVRDLEDANAPAEAGDESVDAVDSIAVEDVSFAYDDGEDVLRNVSFEVDRGEHVGVVGQSGAGKSTLVSLLGRLRQPDAGRIHANGTPIDRFDVEQWRERVAVVRQDPYVFDATLRENLTIANRAAAADDVERACEVAQVTEFLPDLPDGYETELGDDGVRLSGGQRQRVAIARALLAESDVLVLDEATSELDSTIEGAVYDGIAGLDRTFATVSVAHRLSTVVDADRIYAVANGSVAAVGTHEELLAGGGAYADLYASQS